METKTIDIYRESAGGEGRYPTKFTAPCLHFQFTNKSDEKVNFNDL